MAHENIYRSIILRKKTTLNNCGIFNNVGR